jgi:hypothetical protein
MNQLSTAPPPPKSCSICASTESCISISSISGSQHLCLLHFYTTGAHRTASATKDTSNRKKKSSTLVDNRAIHQQLPQVQEVFAEAFTELQKEIREESARVFKSAASSDDPLAALLDGNNAPTQARRTSFGFSSSKKKMKSAGTASDGGFLRR